MKKSSLYLFAVSLTLLLWGCNNSGSFSHVESGFITPPDSIRVGVYWYWISDHISKEGVEKDLQAMKDVGIGRAFIGNILNDGTPVGPIKFYSDQWWNITHAALKKATELDIEIGMFNSPGWSQSGGPWIKANESMRYLSSREMTVSGSQKIEKKLDKPTADFELVKVVAFPKPEHDLSFLTAKDVTITSNPTIANASLLLDGDTATTCKILNREPHALAFKTKSPETIRSLSIITTEPLRCNVELLALNDDGFRSIKKFEVDRSNSKKEVGFYPYAPVVVTFDEVTATEFKVILTAINRPSSIAEVSLCRAALNERYPEKQLAKMFQTPLPLWGEYIWEKQHEVSESGLTLSREQIVDLTDKVSQDGTLSWEAPAGEWVVLWSGMSSTGVTNGPATPEATGLEVDKLSKKHVEKHFDSYLGEMLRRFPEEDRKSFKIVVQDSYETGSQNWTDDFVALFTQRYGYDPTPFIPAFTGRIVESRDMTDRFFWDLRRLIADKVSYDYVGGLRDISHKHNLTTWLENYGHWGYPGEFLQYGGQSDEVAGEFWNEGTLGSIENRAAASCAHIYNKPRVWAESYTSSGNDFGRHPAMLKKRGDWSYTEGINSTLLHLYISQPYEDKKPGVNAWFSTEFNRKNTWFSFSKPFFTYIRRCNFMLQQGKPVNDICYFIGEDAPKMTGVANPPLPQGYSFDYMNGEVILNSLDVVNGEWVLPHGVSYQLFVLPELTTIRPEVLKKLAELVKKGGTLYGYPQISSPSLENYPQADQQVMALSSELWGDLTTKECDRKVGNGRVIAGYDMAKVLDLIALSPDCRIEKSEGEALFVHRSLGNGGDVYFISNQEDKPISLTPQFRVDGMKPELWDALSGSIRPLKAYTAEKGMISVPLTLAPLESAFVVFRERCSQSGAADAALNFPAPSTIADISGNEWNIRFNQNYHGTKEDVKTTGLFDWSTSADPLIKYYSGSAVYTTKMSVSSEALAKENHLRLNLGKVGVMAKVTINGQEAGTVWTAPWSVDITPYIKEGENLLEIEVVNTWVNRLIGDSGLNEAERSTWTMVNKYKPDSELRTSGLVGPVVIEALRY